MNFIFISIIIQRFGGAVAVVEWIEWLYWEWWRLCSIPTAGIFFYLEFYFIFSLGKSLTSPGTTILSVKTPGTTILSTATFG